MRDLLAAQGDACAICRMPWQICEKSSGRHYDGIFLQHLEIDHDHFTGNIRGLLCGPCNIGIGKLCDDIDNCRRAAGYLRRSREA